MHTDGSIVETAGLKAPAAPLTPGTVCPLQASGAKCPLGCCVFLGELLCFVGNLNIEY